MTHFSSPAELIESAGRDLGATEWLTIDQDRINQFAEATEDRQWIHVDTERAKSGPFGTTVAHGYLTLSLVAGLLPQLFTVDGAQAIVNYGLNKVRFPAPVPVGSRVRAAATLATASQRGESVEAAFDVTIEIEGQSRPACTAQTVVIFS